MSITLVPRLRLLRKKGLGRYRRVMALMAVGVIMAGACLAISPHRSLILRKTLPGYWLLVWRGKNLYDADLGILRHGNPALPEVAITIDDGPHPAHCVPMLDELKRLNAPVTFYVVGMEAKAHPELIRRMVAEGHEVGSHTNEHLRLPALTDAQARNTLQNCDINVRLAADAYRMKTLRPPGGEIDARTAKIARELGYTSVLWTDTSGDYEDQAPAYIVREVMGGVENGSIIILHDARPGTVKALPLLVEALRAKGYRLVTVSEMLKHLPKGK